MPILCSGVQNLSLIPSDRITPAATGSEELQLQLLNDLLCTSYALCAWVRPFIYVRSLYSAFGIQ